MESPGAVEMKKLMKEHGLSAPVFLEEGDFFVVKFYGPGDNILDLVPGIPEERQTDLHKLGLNNRQIEVLRMMVNEGKVFTNRMHREKFGVTNKTAATDLNILVNKGMAQVKGKGRNVEYRAK